MKTVDESGAPAGRPDGSGRVRTHGNHRRRRSRGTVVRRPTPTHPVMSLQARPDHAETVISSILHAFQILVKDVLPHDKLARWLERLVTRVLVAVVLTVLGITAIVALVVTAVPWWTVASAASLTAVGGGAAAAWHRAHRRRLPIPAPHRPSEGEGSLGRGE